MRCNESGQKLSARFWPGFILVLLLIGFSASANQIDKNYLHRIWQFEDGLPQNTVQAVTQTKDGYVWAGTQNGLARFDGARFVVFNTNNTPELRSSSITCFWESSDGSLWIGTDDGLTRFKDGRFESFSKEDGLCGNAIRSLCETRDGTLWIGTTEGPCRRMNGTFSPFKTTAFPENLFVRSFFEGKDGKLWMAVNESGLFWYKDGVASRSDSASVQSADRTRTIRAVFEDSEGDIWFGSTEGLHRMKPNGQLVEFVGRTKIGGIVNCIFEDRYRNIWVGTFGGLNRYKDGEVFIQANVQEMPLDVVNSMCSDVEGNIWVGTKEGLNQLKPRSFHAYTTKDGLLANNIMAVQKKRGGGLWISTWGGGVSHLQDGRIVQTLNKDEETLPSDLALGICETASGSLWVGLDFDHGIAKYKDGETIAYRRSALLKDPAVRVIFEDREHNLWIATRTALYKKTESELARLTKADGLAGNYVRVILQDRDGNLWFGTSAGLSLLKDGRFTSYTTADGLSSNVIASLHEDAGGTLWIGTVGGGLNRFRDGRFTAYRQSQGLFRDDVFEILEDDQQRFWMTCRFGIYRVDKKDFEDLDAGKIPRLRSSSYGKMDGLISLECNNVAKPAAIKADDGRLWFCTAKGLAVVDPEQDLRSDQFRAPVLIEEVWADTKQIADFQTPDILNQQWAEVAPGRGDLEFRYTALSLSAPERNMFRYKLEGVDTEWVDAGNRRAAFYSNLKPGRYTFHVEGRNLTGDWIPAKPFAVELLPRFYQTKSFLLGCVFSVVAAGFGIHGIRVNRLRRNEQVLTALIDERTRTLKEEIAQRQQAQAEREKVQQDLVEASRKAGMAEVASGVLHNVGNVLNSVNVAATCSMEHVRNSRRASLAKMASLLQEHESDLPGFFANDPRAKQVPEFLARLSEQLEKEQSATLHELGVLSKSIDHIKDIVAMQQNYARVSGVVEPIDIRELVEDAIRLNAASLARHDLSLKKEYDEVPTVTTDKHKVLQILVNLIRNAKHACEESRSAEKRLTISIRALRHGRVRIVVSDNGVGIAAENMTRIFAHGFTTRATGHGFGLHSSALAARELGGTLKAHSDGPGQGAVFTLEIPIQFQPNNA